jgi:hypothetical protein
VRARTSAVPFACIGVALALGAVARSATVNYHPGTVSVLLNTGDGSFGGKRDYRTGRSPASIAIADLNGDGKPDVATANERGTVSVLLGRGDGGF